MNYVYKITNLENNKSYIGITSRSVDVRWQEHLSRARNDQRNSRLYKAISKYGENNFKVEEIDRTKCEDSVRRLERKYIKEFDTLNNGYNCNEGGCGFLTFPEEIRIKISEGQKGKVISEETRAKMSAAKLGDPRCADHFGDHIEKGSKNPRSKWFKVKDPDGNIIVGKGLRDFCRQNNLQHCHLSSRKRTKGFELLGTFNDHPERE